MPTPRPYSPAVGGDRAAKGFVGVALAVAVAAPVVVAENPTGLLSAQGGGAFAAVLRAFEAAGYAVEWDVLAAGALGAPHRRERVFLVARRDGGRTWPGRGGQPGMFPGRPAAWPAAGRRERGTLMTCARQWPTPRPLPWEVAAGADAMPSQQAHDAEGAGPSAGTVARGGRHSDLRAHLRAALPTPTAKDAADRDYQISGGRDVATLGHAAKAAAGVESQMTRRALPTPAAQDYKDPGADRSGSPHAQPLPQVLRDRGIVGRLSPALPEWMMSLPDGWSLPDGPGLVDAPSRPYLPDLTADLALTTEREHRCSRLRALGNACAADVAEAIARTVLESLR